MKDEEKSGVGVTCLINGSYLVNGTKSSWNKNKQSNCPGVRKRILVSRDPAPVQNGNAAEQEVPGRLQMMMDAANLCTFLGAVLATMAMASMWNKKYYLGMFLNVLANIADIVDGPVARSFPNRPSAYSIVGSKLDCYSDLVSHFVVPASLLMSMSDLHPVCVILACMYIWSGILRQSYFEVTGRCENGSCMYGVTSDYMVAIYCMTMHLAPVIGFDAMTYILSLTMIFMMFASLTFSLRSRRYDGFYIYTAMLFNILLSISCLLLFLFQTKDIAFGAAALLSMHLVFAYPCYFQFVEINK